MKRTETVFASRSELKAYEVLDHHLPDGWYLYANLPMPRLVSIDRSEVTEKKWQFYLKTSVDFVVTNRDHEPALVIEFDGIGGGFSQASKYVLKNAVPGDPYRELKLNFKLELCRNANLPMIVISFEEVESIESDDILTIANSLVGMHVATHHYKETIERWDREGRGKGKSFEEMLWEDSTLRTELQFMNDPFLMKLETIYDDFEKLGASWNMRSLSRPDQMTAMKNKKAFESVGCHYVVKGGKLKAPVVMTAWVRNFAGKEMGYSLDPEFLPESGINPLKVAQNIAWYLSHKKAVQISDARP